MLAFNFTSSQYKNVHVYIANICICILHHYSELFCFVKKFIVLESKSFPHRVIIHRFGIRSPQNIVNKKEEVDLLLSVNSLNSICFAKKALPCFLE